MFKKILKNKNKYVRLCGWPSRLLWDLLRAFRGLRRPPEWHKTGSRGPPDRLNIVTSTLSFGYIYFSNFLLLFPQMFCICLHPF